MGAASPRLAAVGQGDRAAQPRQLLCPVRPAFLMGKLPVGEQDGSHRDPATRRVAQRKGGFRRAIDGDGRFGAGGVKDLAAKFAIAGGGHWVRATLEASGHSEPSFWCQLQRIRWVSRSSSSR